MPMTSADAFRICQSHVSDELLQQDDSLCLRALSPLPHPAPDRSAEIEDLGKDARCPLPASPALQNVLENVGLAVCGI